MVMSRTPVAVKRGPARIGQHTREVLAGAGLTDAEIGVLKSIGAIKLDGETA
jgi:crotonobetainyl-CoA:carnitine CoA-transferase CaiB-like acyl-CoA transferase